MNTACIARIVIPVMLACSLGKGAENEPATELYETARMASIEVLVDGHLSGSGWIADSEGVVLTACHVVGDAEKKHLLVEIRSTIAGRLDAKIEALDAAHDLARLRVPKRDGGYPSLRLAEKVPVAGTTTFFFGVAHYRHALLFRGSVASNRTIFEFEYGNNEYAEVAMVNAVSMEQNSGGPWLNLDGEVIGLNSASLKDNRNASAITFIIPVDALRDLMKTKTLEKTPTIGAEVFELSGESSDFIHRFPLRTEGVFINRLNPDSPLIQAGIKEKEVIVAVDRESVRSVDELIGYVRRKKVRDEVELTILDAGVSTPRKVKVQLAEVTN